MKKVALLLIPLLASCTAPDRTRDTLRKAGFTDVQAQGWDMWACGEDDWYSTHFTAKNNQGQRIEGTVCCGLWTKQCTIRF